MEDKAILTSYQKSPDEGHSYPEVVAQPDHSEPTYTPKETGNPVYEPLPGERGHVAVRHERRMSPTGAPAGKRLEGQSTIYGEQGLPPRSKKKAYKDRSPASVKVQPGRRQTSSVVACGAAVLFVGLALVLSIAALVLFVFIFLGILPLSGATLDIDSLRKNVSALEQRVMELNESSYSTVAPPLDMELAQFVDIRVVNFSDCRLENRSCEVGVAGCSTNIPMAPEFLNASLPERTRVVVEQSCWFSDIKGGIDDLRTAMRISSLGGTNMLFYHCDCSAGTFRDGASAVCHFYFKECALINVRVQQT